MPHQPTARLILDEALAALRAGARSWTDWTPAEKLTVLRRVRRAMAEVAPRMVEASVAAKGIDAQSAGEEWVAGPVTMLRTTRYLLEALDHVRLTGRSPVHARPGPGGRRVARVMPRDIYDRILYMGHTADVWLLPGSQSVELAGRQHGDGSVEHRVSLVLGAGNVMSIPVLDVLQRVFVDGDAAMLKLNPVNDYLGPHLERMFRELIDADVVRIAYGGPEVGEYLVNHEVIDSVHLTGSAATHDSIVFGSGPEGRRRKLEGRPRLAKHMTSELGNVSPVIFAPGDWSDGEIRHQAEHLATQLQQNAGFNCNASKVIVLPEGWEAGDRLLAEVGEVLASLAPRPAYYPGAAERHAVMVGSHANVRLLGRPAPGALQPALLMDVDADSDHVAFHRESFCATAAVTRLPASTPEQFLDAAVRFCNERLYGTLNATIIAKDDAIVGPAVEGLRYGTIGVNIWAAAGYVLGSTPWGAYPGALPADIQSGVGFVHNGLLIGNVEKTVISAPFRPIPKPPWFITHRRATATLRRAAAFEASPRALALPGILASAVRT